MIGTNSSFRSRTASLMLALNETASPFGSAVAYKTPFGSNIPFIL